MWLWVLFHFSAWLVVTQDVFCRRRKPTSLLFFCAHLCPAAPISVVTHAVPARAAPPLVLAADTSIACRHQYLLLSLTENARSCVLTCVREHSRVLRCQVMISCGSLTKIGDFCLSNHDMFHRLQERVRHRFCLADQDIGASPLVLLVAGARGVQILPC